MEKNLLEKLK